MINDYLKLVRLEEWAPRFLILIFGYMLSGQPTFANIGALLIALICFLAIGCFGFIINDYFDREYDKWKKDNRNPFSNNRISPKSGILLSMLLAALGLGLSYAMLPRVFLLFLISSILLVIYSAPPLRLKEKFAFDIVVNAFDLPVLFLIGYMLFGNFNIPISLLTLEVLFLGLTSGILQEIRDYNADKKSGFSTTVVKTGIKNGIRLLQFVFIVFVVSYSLTIYLYFPVYLLLLILPLIPVMKFVFFDDVASEISSQRLTSIFHRCVLIFLPLITVILYLRFFS